MHFEFSNSIIECWSATKTGNAIVVHAVNVHSHSINSVFKFYMWLKVQIGGWITKLTSAFFTVQDLTLDTPLTPKKMIGSCNITFCQQGADTAG